MEDSRSSSREKIGSAQGYSHITKLPQQSRDYQPKKLHKFRNHPHFRSETVLTRFASTNVFRLWKWETFNCVLAIGMLGSMYGILKRYDGQRIPDWGSAINLSTLIALMATLLRTMLVFVVAEIIGQAKWQYFAYNGRSTENPPMRRLIETSRFNDASQGLLGAVKLIPTIARDPAILLVVMVLIISLGTGSFVQQAIQTQSCYFSVDNAHASLPVSYIIDPYAVGTSKAGDSNIQTLDESNIAAALTSALTPDSEEIGSPIAVTCPTGNCTFQNPIGGVYNTLGACSSCADTSSLVTSTEWTLITDNCDPGGRCDMFTAKLEYALPNGMVGEAFLDNITFHHTQGASLLVSPELRLDWAGDLASPDMKALSQWAFANITVLTPSWLSTSSGYTNYVAVTCTLYPCLRSYTGLVKSGKLTEVLVSTDPAVVEVAPQFEPNVTIEAVQEALSGFSLADFKNEDAGLLAVQSPCLVNDTVWTKENKSSTLDLYPLFFVHADPDPDGAFGFRVESTAAPEECIYGLTQGAVDELSKAANSFNGSCFTSGSIIDSSAKVTHWQTDCGETYWLAGFLADDPNGTTAASIIERIEAFTDRLSNKIRMGLFNNPEAVSGQVLHATVCSRIHYSWLTFPAVLVAVTSGLLAWTMLRNSRCRGREMVWKSSILPFLFYGERFVVKNGEDVSGYSTEESRRDGPKEPLLNLGQMEAEAKQRAVRFDAFD